MNKKIVKSESSAIAAVPCVNINNTESFHAFNTIMELMNCPNFRALFDTNFNTFSDIESVLLIMKTYQYIESIYIDKNGVKPTMEYMRRGIQNIIADKIARRFLVDSMKRFISEKETFSEIVEKQQLLTIMEDSDKMIKKN
ncbi:MAG: hypothetical protein CBB84_000050 [Phycisphaera sp. TMED24]|nr:MAG: hypothetical protein CBB84_000050 [Phycisphaera sp. TMED24]|tara:strand:+ start:537 stop:959 length:423 start_codon:yes stop_codon:yes gene_type:complete